MTKDESQKVNDTLTQDLAGTLRDIRPRFLLKATPIWFTIDSLNQIITHLRRAITAADAF